MFFRKHSKKHFFKEARQLSLVINDKPQVDIDQSGKAV
jgi:hypothetical protein